MIDIESIEWSPMPVAMEDRLRAKWCQPQTSWLWNEMRVVTPVLLPVVHGNGRQLLAVRPIVTRRSHFVVAIDSSIEVGGDKGMVHDIMDGLNQELEIQFGMCDCHDCLGELDEEDVDQFEEWPRPCFSIGCEWWVLTNQYLRMVTNDLKATSVNQQAAQAGE